MGIPFTKHIAAPPPETKMSPLVKESDSLVVPLPEIKSSPIISESHSLAASPPKFEGFPLVRENKYGKLVIEKHDSFNDSSPAFIVAVHGSQKIGKSQLANILWRTNFEVGGNLGQRTTEGIDGCYIKDSQVSLIILDCEGEKSQQKRKIIEQEVNSLQRLTEKEKIEETESIFKASDQRYASLLWCSVHCLIMLLPEAAPNDDLLNFFKILQDSISTIKTANHKICVILLIRTRDKEEFCRLKDAYQEQLKKYSVLSSLARKVVILQLPKYKGSPEEDEKFQSAAKELREEVSQQFSEFIHEMTSVDAWYETLKYTAHSLNNNIALKDLTYLRVETELGLTLNKNKVNINKMADFLDQLIQQRKIFKRDYRELDIEALQKMQKDKLKKIQEANLKVLKHSLVGLGLMLTAPVGEVISVVSSVDQLRICAGSLKIVRDEAKELGKITKEFEEDLDPNVSLIRDYADIFEKTKNTLKCNDQTVRRLELFYAIAQYVLRTKDKPNPTPEACFRLLFDIFVRNEDISLEDNDLSISKEFSADFKNKINAAAAKVFSRQAGANRAIQRSITETFCHVIDPFIGGIFKFLDTPRGAREALHDILKTFERENTDFLEQVQTQDVDLKDILIA